MRVLPMNSPSEDEGFAAEVQMCLSRLDCMLDQFEIDSWFADDLDSSDAIVSVNPGQGGLEAQDWTDMLYRMYSRYVEKKGWKLKVLDVVPGEGIGLDRRGVPGGRQKRLWHAAQ